MSAIISLDVVRSAVALLLVSLSGEGEMSEPPFGDLDAVRKLGACRDLSNISWMARKRRMGMHCKTWDGCKKMIIASKKGEIIICGLDNWGHIIFQ